ncbi:hypothetical protein B0T21DRAFT_373874 [Apiosordaria backusii]|uniref:Transmembrane protein n=1 Tax=Apiosordaria backusii TaxID=314023 RepID=A0AA40E1K2_9PEZI|nr:hypothetical protein B0T21DRAFT_373874 [Apiosordaria backusii]
MTPPVSPYLQSVLLFLSVCCAHTSSLVYGVIGYVRGGLFTVVLDLVCLRVLSSVSLDLGVVRASASLESFFFLLLTCSLAQLAMLALFRCLPIPLSDTAETVGGSEKKRGVTESTTGKRVR